MSPIPAVGSCGQTCSNNQARDRCLLFRTRFASRDRRNSRRRCIFRMTSSCRNCSCFSASAISASRLFSRPNTDFARARAFVSLKRISSRKEWLCAHVRFGRNACGR